MAKYYNEYRSLKPKKGLTVLLAIIAVILIAAISLTVAFLIVPAIRGLQSRGNDPETVVDPPKEGEEIVLTELKTPYELELDITQTKLSWKCIDHIKSVGYRIKINDAEFNVYTNPVTINLIEGADSNIYVKALGDNKEFSDSKWSDVLTVYKQDAQTIAYNIILDSMESILKSKVSVPVGGVYKSITVENIYTIDYNNYGAKVWYSYKTENSQGLAVTSISMINVNNVLEYKNKLNQIDAIINSNNISTELLPYISEDKSADLLARADLTGSLANFRHQSISLTPICSNTSLVTVADGKASFTIRGIVRRERQNHINYYIYNYTAMTAEVGGYTSQDYLDALADSSKPFTFSEISAVEINGLGKEMLIMYGDI